MKKILIAVLFLLPFLVKAQSINNQKVRWMQPIYMGSNTAATVNASSDTGAFFFDRADSVLYFKYKGAARAIGYAGSIPNVGQQITDSLKALVRLRASGSGGIDVQNSSGTSVANFGSGGSTNISLNGSTNVNARLSVTDSIVGVNQRLTGNLGINSGRFVDFFLGNKDGADAIGAGPYWGLSQTSNAKQWVHQLNSNVDFVSWHYNGSTWINPITIKSSGNTELSGNVLINTTTDNGSRLQVNGTASISGALTATAQGNNIAYTVDSTTISTSNYTLVAGDASKRFYIKNSSTAITVTIPADASVNFPVGTEIIFFQDGTGDITIAGASGVNIKSESNFYKIETQYCFVGIAKLSANTWAMTGRRKL